MASNEAYTFYQWSKNRPTTTNAEYGWTLKVPLNDNNNKSKISGRHAKSATLDENNRINGRTIVDDCHTRHCDASLQLALDPYDDRIKRRRCEICELPSNLNGININRGYVTGHVPVTEKISKNKTRVPGGRRLEGQVTDSEGGAGKQREDICLWHSLSGALVHCPNYKARNDRAAEVY